MLTLILNHSYEITVFFGNYLFPVCENYYTSTNTLMKVMMTVTVTVTKTKQKSFV